MSFNGSGTYSLPTGNPVAAGTNILASWANSTLQDIAAALSLVLPRDGQSAMTGALNMGTQNILNAGAISTATLTATGVVSLGNINVTSASAPVNGAYLSAANTLTLTANAVDRVKITPSSVQILGTGIAGDVQLVVADGAASSLVRFGTQGVITSSGGGYPHFGYNLVPTGTANSFKYGSADFASAVRFGSGGVQFFTAPSGAAAGAITLTQIAAFAQNGTLTLSPASNVGLTINAASANYCASMFGAAAAGTSFGARINAGTNASDVAFLIGNAAASVNYLQVRGDGLLQNYEPLNGINALKNSATYENGTFTGTLTGCTTSPTGTINWSRNGAIVTLEIPAISATSNSIGCTITGLPAALIPARTQYLYAPMIDNGTVQLGQYQVVAGQSIIYLNLGAAGTTNFTTSGSKGAAGGTTITYRLA